MDELIITNTIESNQLRELLSWLEEDQKERDSCSCEGSNLYNNMDLVSRYAYSGDVYIAMRSDKIVAFMMLSKIDPDVVMIDMIKVIDSHKRSGIATEMIDYIPRIISTCSSIKLDPVNELAITIFKRIGFDREELVSNSLHPRLLKTIKQT